MIETSDFYFCLSFSGEFPFNDDEDEGVIGLKLPQVPLPNEKEKFTVTLQSPTGYPAKLGEDKSCVVTVNHDLGEYHLLYDVIMVIICMKDDVTDNHQCEVRGVLVP